MSNHTKEPWEIADSEMPNEYLVYAEGETLHLAEFHGPNAKERAKRAIACVNALSGINPKAVGEMFALLKNFASILPESEDRAFYELHYGPSGVIKRIVEETKAAIALAEKEE